MTILSEIKLGLLLNCFNNYQDRAVRAFKYAFATLLLLPIAFAQTALAQDSLDLLETKQSSDDLSSLFTEAPTFLKVEQAFGFDFEQQGDKLIIKWDIEPGYYLYKRQFSVATKNATLGEPSYPPHEQIEDEYFGISDVFFNDMEMVYPIINAKQDSSVKIRFQGCAKAGLCYPPTTQVVYLNVVKSDLLSPQEAVTISPSFAEDATNLELNVETADGYYLKQDSISIDSFVYEFGDFTLAEESADNEGQLAGRFTINFPVLSHDEESPAAPQANVSYQICHLSGVCYTASELAIDLSTKANSAASASSDGKLDDLSVIDTISSLTDKDKFTALLESEQYFLIGLALLIIGLGIAFTPCVYPMYPILSSIVIGKGKQQPSTSKAFALSFIYVQGMAITYSIVGLIVASVGVQFQAVLQNPILLGVLAIVFVLLALSMFGLYEIQLPSAWQNRLNKLSDGQKQGNYFGVFIMGVVSGLVASPCTTAPLTAILLLVAQSDSLVFGFFALYTLSIGMGIPLILFGVTGGKLLPKAGAWMNVVKASFGFIMLTLAILFIERFWISEYTNLLWALLGLSLFGYWYTVNQNTQTSFAKGIRNVVVVSGLVVSVLFSVITLQKLQLIPTLVSAVESEQQHEGHPEFMVVKSLSDLEQKVAQANAEGKTVMIDLYADWCVACKEFEKYTFPSPVVVDALSDAVWMQIDLTDNTASNNEFNEHFNIYGLPTIMFFDKQGNELTKDRVTGFMSADPFASHVRKVLPND